MRLASYYDIERCDIMDNLDKLIKEIKSMDKKSRQKLLLQLTGDNDTSAKLASVLEDEAIRKKLKEILG